MKDLTAFECRESVERWKRDQEAAARLRAERVTLAISASAILGLSAIQILYDEQKAREKAEAAS